MCGALECSYDEVVCSKVITCMTTTGQRLRFSHKRHNGAVAYNRRAASDAMDYFLNALDTHNNAQNQLHSQGSDERRILMDGFQKCARTIAVATCEAEHEAL